MKKAVFCGAMALAAAVVIAQTFPDIKRYLRIRRM